jgi:hypothetical protein
MCSSKLCAVGVQPLWLLPTVGGGLPMGTAVLLPRLAALAFSVGGKTSASIASN